MTQRNSGWTPDRAAAVRDLIRQTVDNAGAVDPAVLPHQVREALKGLAVGDIDVEAYIDECLRARRRSHSD